MNCLQGFNEESSRDKHLDYYINNESVKVEMPHKKPIVQYSDGQLEFNPISTGLFCLVVALGVFSTPLP